MEIWIGQTEAEAVRFSIEILLEDDGNLVGVSQRKNSSIEMPGEISGNSVRCRFLIEIPQITHNTMLKPIQYGESPQMIDSDHLYMYVYMEGL